MLFPQSYASTGEWLRSLSGRARAVLDDTTDALAAAAAADPEFSALAGGLEVGGGGARMVGVAGSAHAWIERPATLVFAMTL